MQQFEKDYREVFPKQATGKPKGRELVYYDHKISGGKWTWKDRLKEIKKDTFQGFDLIINNTNYTPEYLSKIYVVEYWQILEATQERIKRQIELHEKASKKQ